MTLYFETNSKNYFKATNLQELPHTRGLVNLAQAQELLKQIGHKGETMVGCRVNYSSPGKENGNGFDFISQIFTNQRRIYACNGQNQFTVFASVN
jgi:hypothetical protein